MNTTKKKVMDVDLDLLRIMSIDLAKKIKAQGYKPDHILYIERAGILTGYEISKYFNTPVSGIVSSRSGSCFKSSVKSILRLLPRFITHFLRRLELGSSIHNVNSKRNVICQKPLPPKNKKILVVDDALDTGHSIAAVLNWLKRHDFDLSGVKTAVLTTTGKKHYISADFTLLDNTICAFPWSYDSRQYYETKILMDAVRSQITNYTSSTTNSYGHAIPGPVGLTRI